MNFPKGNRVYQVYLLSFFKREENILIVTKICWQLKKRKIIFFFFNEKLGGKSPETNHKQFDVAMVKVLTKSNLEKEVFLSFRSVDHYRKSQ